MKEYKSIDKRIWLSSPHMGGNELSYINEAFNANWIAPLGPNINAFEDSLKGYCGLKNAVALSSGTAAIHLALIVLGVERGDEVLASSFTFSATINPIIYQGAIPILIDSEPDTWNMCPDLLEEAIVDRIAIGKKPKAIVLVHLYGMPANIERIVEIAGKFDVPIIEDAAEALGSRFKGKPVGSYGTLSVISFNGNKIITTSGGGALLSDNIELVEKARFLATQARDDAPHYQHSNIGYNYRLSNVLAGIGLGQMEILDKRVNQRRKNHQFYSHNLHDYKELMVLEEPNSMYFSNFWLTTILIDSTKTRVTREDLRIAFEGENIETRPTWKPMHLQPIFSDYPSYLNGISEAIFNDGLCLPSGSNLNEQDRQRILKVFKESLL